LSRREIIGSRGLDAAIRDADAADTPVHLDLRGVKCPLNWAHAKVRLEGMRRGEVIQLRIDDPRSVRDIPRAAETEGHSIIDVQDLGPEWLLIIEK
jgi:tRNA 2-thiouridine synthesizing protein A